jgi:hypothetical protein
MATLKDKRVWIVIAVVVLVPVLAVAWWLVAPLFIDKTVEEEFPLAANAVVPSDMTMEEAETTMSTMAKVDSEMTEPMDDEMAEAAALKTGEFMDADSFHKGSGTATVYSLPEGGHVLRLENFKVTNGPDLRVFVTPSGSPASRDDVHEPGYLELGKLKGNIGNQNYPFPEGADPSDANAVVIYCKPFSVIFSVAELR